MMTLPSRAPKRKLGNYFGKEIKVLKILGISLTGNESTAYKIYSVVILLAIVFMYPLLDTYELTKHDADVVAELMTFSVGELMALTKALALLRNRGQLRKLFGRLEEEPFALNLKRGGEFEETLIRRCIRITAAQSFAYWSVVCFTFFAELIYTLPARIGSSDYDDWKFGFGPFTVLNVTYSPNYEISYFYQNISVLCLAGNFTTGDLVLAGVLAHISCQFKILQNCIRLLVETSYKEMVENTRAQVTQKSSKDVSVVFWKYLKKSLKSAVHYHLAIVDLAEKLENIFSFLLLLTVLSTLGELCFSIYSGSVAKNTVILGKHVGVSIGICFQVFLVGYWGEQVVHESQQVGIAAYKSNFVGTDVRYQKSLTMVIRSSQIPCKITAGKFTAMSLTTFTWILRTSYSAFTVLRTAEK